MRFEAEPHPTIHPYVASYWGFVRDLSTMREFSVTPDSYVEVLFFVDPPSVIEANGNTRRLPACTAIPLLDAPLRLATAGTMRCASMRLHGWAAGIVLPEPSRSTQPWADASARFSDAIPLVTAALKRTAWPEIVATFDATLLRAFAAAGPAALALDAVRRYLRPRRDRSGAAEPTTTERLSRRQMERRVRSLANRSPKELTSLERFQFVRDTLWARPDTALDRLALDAGYSDQAHLSRHFRRYADRSPVEFKRECVRLAAFLQAADVANLQDDAL